MIKLWKNDIPGYNKNYPECIPSITPYIINNNEKTPAVIVVPGGAYTHKADHEGAPVALWLNSIGINAFVLDYRVSPYMYPYPVMDGQRAVRYVRYHAKDWNIDENRIGILGFSAGGHLACTVGTHFDSGIDGDEIDHISSKPDIMILCYPVITFGKYRHDGSRRALLGDNPDEKLIYSLSDENMVTENTPPTFLWHTANDESVPVENSLMFAAALSKNNVPFEAHIFADGRHGLGLASDNAEVSVWTKLCENWLRKIKFIEKR